MALPLCLHAQAQSCDVCHTGLLRTRDYERHTKSKAHRVACLVQEGVDMETAVQQVEQEKREEAAENFRESRRLGI